MRKKKGLRDRRWRGLSFIGQLTTYFQMSNEIGLLDAIKPYHIRYWIKRRRRRKKKMRSSFIVCLLFTRSGQSGPFRVADTFHSRGGTPSQIASVRWESSFLEQVMSFADPLVPPRPPAEGERPSKLSIHLGPAFVYLPPNHLCCHRATKAQEIWIGMWRCDLDRDSKLQLDLMS